ncbi:MAG: hypothetical protein PHV82_17380, partial [Victivallaceae bacterium]|nr:hypothetical protein [Victivallaceae bacterium]
VGILSADGTHAEAKKALIEKFGISDRQAFRYLKIAQESSGLLVIPEKKAVFTVKLPVSLIFRIRQRAQLSDYTLSDLVAEALEIFLKMGGKSGKEEKRTQS